MTKDADGQPDLVVAYVEQKPLCDFDKSHGSAEYDGATTLGPWAYMCLSCYNKYGTGLGTGRGQKLELKGTNYDNA